MLPVDDDWTWLSDVDTRRTSCSDDDLQSPLTRQLDNDVTVKDVDRLVDRVDR